MKIQRIGKQVHMPGHDDARPFPEDVVAGVLAHMNGDHADDSLVICKALGERPDAIAAVMTGFDDRVAIFDVTVPEGAVEMRFEWDRPVNDRTDVRKAVVAMFRDAQARLGINPA
ncbi:MULTISPECIES: DUF2470 domain-containing protein [Gordonia]|jgi:hypothetical protein|nr:MULTISPECIES: DUF2470 domain-containing protein [Gordonia]MDH3012251.1 DUF2470 domain-containing protein [Gordonia alkanivorans]MDH3021082.1 DUF2470 domain-containing protein [Gordonia alkanivorans]MDH3025815.1 DUF2470 domain-containing protein [Gordonia alkanivorans]MDH3042835.1 DUF2470 domain-containing protein [Gordonia alkanivorans]MDH3046607.1 DUF2470 domain-containing protein [Gordonia alkanivorans]